MATRPSTGRAPRLIDRRAEDMHDLSFKPGHHNYYAFAEGMAFAAWILRYHRTSGESTEELYRLYTQHKP
jgi:hypothetical protein